MFLQHYSDLKPWGFTFLPHWGDIYSGLDGVLLPHANNTGIVILLRKCAVATINNYSENYFSDWNGFLPLFCQDVKIFTPAFTNFIVCLLLCLLLKMFDSLTANNQHNCCNLWETLPFLFIVQDTKYLASIWKLMMCFILFLLNFDAFVGQPNILKCYMGNISLMLFFWHWCCMASLFAE